MSMEQNQDYRDPNTEVMSMGDWLITLIVGAIPCVGIIMLFVWAFGNGNENRKNFCRAQLVVTLIVTVLMVILYIGVFATLFANFSYYY